MSPAFMKYRALLLLLPCLAACAPDTTNTIVIQNRTEQGLLELPQVTARAWVGTLLTQGSSAFFTSDIIPASTYTVHSSGRIWVARGAVQVTFVDREGRPQSVRATPCSPGEWKADLRTVKDRDKRSGFFLRLEPMEGKPLQADGVVLEVTYRPG